MRWRGCPRRFVGVLITPAEYYRLRTLSRLVSWPRTAGLSRLVGHPERVLPIDTNETQAYKGNYT